MRKQYNPTPADRCKAACAFDNIYRGQDTKTHPSHYTADGATVTDKEGFTVWAVTAAEAREVGICYGPEDTVTVNRRKWVVVNA